MNTASPLAVVAIGGHSLLGQPDAPGTAGQWLRAREMSEHLAQLVAAGLRLVVTHGNGPQVGQTLRRSELASAEVPALSMDVAVAHTQGGIGYMLARGIADALAQRGLSRPVVALVTQTLVAADDPAFEAPTKPIGSYMTAAQAEQMDDEWGRQTVFQPGRGWRRVVASPRPQAVVELPSICALVAGGNVVIAAGGGGIPVVREGERLRGVPAVVDKDLVSSLLARELAADLFLLATDVERLALNFGTPEEVWLERLTVAEAERYLADGQFPAGSMGPKVTAATEYLAAGGKRVVIAHTECIVEAWRGRAGTEIEPASEPAQSHVPR